jgi:molecular chaperone GrpE
MSPMESKVNEEAKASGDAAAAPSPAESPVKEDVKPPEDFYGQLLRLKAEFENYRKRTDREKPEFYKAGRADMMFKLLPLFDVLRQAHKDIQASHAQTPAAKGMELIFKEFEKLFKEEGVTVMEPVGKPYDSSKQEVLGAVEKEGVSEGDVVDVLQDGYMQGERVLRTAKVRIAKKTQS